MSSVPRVRLSPSVDVSRLIYGCWRLTEGEEATPAGVQAKLEACLAQGISTIDQADIYGGYTSEALLGRCLHEAPALKDQIELITKADIVMPAGRHSASRLKYYDTSAAHLTASVEASLELLGIDAIDIFLIHRPDPLMDHEETGRALDGLIQAGKIKAAGVSNFRPWDFDLLQSAMSNRLVTNQIEISALHHDPLVNGDIAHLQLKGVRPMAWSPLGRGEIFSGRNPDLTGKLHEVAARLGSDIGSVALAWLLKHPSGICPVVGSNTLTRIASYWKAFDVTLDRETWFEIYTAARGQEVA